MHILYLVVTLVTIILNAGIAVADFGKATFVVANSTEVGVPMSWLPVLATLKAAGAAGLLAGLLGIDPLGIAAATGLVAFFIGAVLTHVRARVFYNIAFPGAFLAFAVGSLVLAIAR